MKIQSGKIVESQNFPNRKKSPCVVRMLASISALACGSIVTVANAGAGGYVGTRVGASYDNVDTRGTGAMGELFGGFRFTENWALELGIFGMTESVDLPVESSVLNNLTGDRLQMRGASISARYTLPISERVRFYGRVGLANFDVEQRLEVQVLAIQGNPPVATEVTYPIVTHGNSFGSVLALGVDTALSQRWRVGAELQHYRGDLREGPVSANEPWRGMAFNQSGSLQAAMVTLVADF